MNIHVVQPGETIDTIANKYGVSAKRLIQENELTDPNSLVIGETIVILYPELTYMIQEGDTLLGIANAHNVTVMQILKNNPYLSEREFIYPGEEIVISYRYDKNREISVNGYAFPFIDERILRKTLPFLTYLTIFNYRITDDGEIVDIDDAEIVRIATEYGVASIMIISTSTATQERNYELIHNILISDVIQNRLIDNVLTNIKVKGYYGLNVDFQDVLPSDQQLYVDFIEKITSRLNQEGYEVFVTITPTTFETEIGRMYQGLDYAGIGQAANGTILLSYEWGFDLRIPIGVISFSEVKQSLDYAVTQIMPGKIYIGIPSIGYVWKLPFEEGISIANAISHSNAIELAREVGATILYNEISEAPFFQYVSEFEYIVWFKDARSIDALVKLVPEYDLQGIGTWQIMSFFAQMWLVINSQYEIEKVLR